MAIVYESGASTTIGTNDTTPTFNMPSTRPDDNLYVVIVTADGGVGSGLAFSGWTAVAAASDEGAVGLRAWWRYGSSEPASYTGTGGPSEQYSIMVYRFSGMHPSAGIGTTSGVDYAQGTGNSTTAIAPTVTPDVTGGYVIRAWGIDTDSPTPSAPSGHTLQGGASSSSGGGANTVFGEFVTDDTRTTDGVSEGTVTCAGSYDDNWTALTLVIQPITPVLKQEKFVGLEDDNSIDIATQKAATNTNWSQNVDENFRVRFVVAETAGADPENGHKLQYNLASAGWNDVNGSSSVVRSFASTWVANDAATGETLGGTGTFEAGKFDEVDGAVDATFSASRFTEHEFCVQIRNVDVSDGQTVQLRLIGTTNGAYGTYTNTPTITIVAPSQQKNWIRTGSVPGMFGVRPGARFGRAW